MKEKSTENIFSLSQTHVYVVITVRVDHVDTCTYVSMYPPFPITYPVPRDQEQKRGLEGREGEWPPR
mgnify:CR=1 FL=1